MKNTVINSISMAKTTQVKSVSVPVDQAKYAEKNNISLSRVVQDELARMMKKNDPHRHMPIVEIRSFINNYMVVLGLGIVILLATLVLSPYLLQASIGVTIALYIVGGVTTVYGAWEYGFWHGILKRRARA